jgi:hypothetical protein
MVNHKYSKIRKIKTQISIRMATWVSDRYWGSVGFIFNQLRINNYELEING